MPIVNQGSRTITCKLVYFGPGCSGKTSNLTYLYSTLSAEDTGELTSFATRRARTLKFEYTPRSVDSIGPYRVGFEICAVPGQSSHQGAREQMLEGADGVVFVADSRLECLDDNINSLRDLRQILAAHRVSARSLPFVFQYNKQNLPADQIATVTELSAVLNFKGAPEFAADATNGEGVLETLQSITSQLLVHLGARQSPSASVASPELDFDSLEFEMQQSPLPKAHAT